MPTPKDESLLVSSLIYRRVVGFIGLTLPFALILFSGFALKPSISDYYHSNLEDVFVGSMCAVGVFLCCYKGYDIKDWALCLVAGSAAVLLALCPVAEKGAGHIAQIKGDFHLGFAAIFLGTLAALSLFQFTKSDPKGPKRKKITSQKAVRDRVYKTCGWVMVACLLLIVAYKLTYEGGAGDPLAILRPVFFLESIAVISFGVSWLIKGEMFFGDK